MTNCAVPELALQGGVAICRQIQTQIRDFIVQGRLRPGEELPTVRAMAVELAVNPEVVQKAYIELEREEIVTSREGSGIFVAAQPWSQPRTAEDRGAFEGLCSELLARAAHYGFSSEDVIAEINLLSNRTPLS
jgi:GntR family transcriptional regulator